MKQTEHFLSNLILTLSANLIIPLPPSLRLMKLSRNYESNTVAVVSLLCNYWDITDSRNFHAEMKSRNLAARNSSAMIGGDPEGISTPVHAMSAENSDVAKAFVLIGEIARAYVKRTV